MTLVWSERNELHDPTGAVHDCYVCAPLMCLVHGGFTAFPLGIYSALEREALERSDTQPDEEGGSPDDADLGIKNRYGLELHKPTATDTKRGILTTPNLAVSVGGRPIDAPVDSIIRKYLPNYTGGHRGTYLTTEKLWFDPMAPNESLGQPCSVEDVLAFSSGRAVTDYRYTVRGQYATQGGINEPGGTDMGFHFHLPPNPRAGTTKLVAGKVVYRCSDNVVITIADTVSRPSTEAASRVEGDPNSKPGSLVDVNHLGVAETCFAVAADHPFTAGSGAATTLAPGIYEVA
jgi:hypothetical protein